MWDTVAVRYVLGEDPDQIALAPEVDRLVVGSGSYRTRAKVFDLKSGKEPVKLAEDVAAEGVAVTPHGTRIATTNTVFLADKPTRQLWLWDGATGKRLRKLDLGEGHGSPPAFSPDGKRIAASVGGEVVVVDAETGKETARAKGHRGTAWAVTFSPGGAYLASCGDDGKALLWQLAAMPAARP